ncbi:MAG: ABC transporter permease [Acidobacteriota bacterium]
MRTNWINVYAVVRREFLERVRKKSFLIMTILTPLLFGGLMVGSVLLQVVQTKKSHVVVVDKTGWAGPLVIETRKPAKTSGGLDAEAEKSVRDSLTLDLAKPDASMEALKKDIGDQELDGVLLLEPDGQEDLKATYMAQNLANAQIQGLLQGRVNEALLQHRLQGMGLDPAIAQKLKGRVELATVKVEKGGKTREGSVFSDFIKPFLLAMLIYMMIIMYGVAIMNGVLEEKNSKVVEVILSAVRPFELMMGKIIGIAAVGLLQYGIWFLLGAGLYLANPMNLQAQSAGPWLRPMEMVLLVFYFLFGFVFYSSIYAAVGATCTTQQEAQQWQMPVTMFLIVPIMLMVPTIQNPNAPWVVVMSLIPLCTPITMLLRVSVVDVPLWQIAASVVSLVGGTVVVAWAAARVYRVGILMTGKRPSIPEVIRWVRAG